MHTNIYARKQHFQRIGFNTFDTTARARSLGHGLKITGPTEIIGELGRLSHFECEKVEEGWGYADRSAGERGIAGRGGGGNNGGILAQVMAVGPRRSKRHE